jgi:hypothetical protein
MKKMLQVREFELQGKDCRATNEGYMIEVVGYARSKMDQGGELLFPLRTHLIEIIHTSARGKINHKLRRMIFGNFMAYNTRQLDNLL